MSLRRFAVIQYISVDLQNVLLSLQSPAASIKLINCRIICNEKVTIFLQYSSYTYFIAKRKIRAVFFPRKIQGNHYNNGLPHSVHWIIYYKYFDALRCQIHS